MDGPRASKVMGLHYFLSATEIEELAAACGFTVQYKEEFGRAYKFNSFDEFMRFGYGTSGGLVDAQFTDIEELQKFKKDHETESGFTLNLTSCIF